MKKWVRFSFYRPPKSNMKIFFDELNKYVDKVYDQNFYGGEGRQGVVNGEGVAVKDA